MPRLVNSEPKHKASGQAVVTLDGKDHYLGPHGTRASKREYDRLVGEWLQNGRQLRPSAGESNTVAALLAAYWKFSQTYYVKNGRPTDELPGLKIALRFVRSTYGDTLVRDFGPLSLENVQSAMVKADHSDVLTVVKRHLSEQSELTDTRQTSKPRREPD